MTADAFILIKFAYLIFKFNIHLLNSNFHFTLIPYPYFILLKRNIIIPLFNRIDQNVKRRYLYVYLISSYLSNRYAVYLS